MVRRLGRRDLLWVAAISGVFALLTIQVVLGSRGYDRPPPGALWRVLGAPGIALGWGGVALLLVAIPYTLLAWMRGVTPGKAISAIGALVLALGVGGLAAAIAANPHAGGGVLGGGLGGMLKDAMGPGLATAILALVCVPGVLLALAPVVLEAKGSPPPGDSDAPSTASILGGGKFTPESIPVAPGVRARYPERRVGPDGEELPMEFSGSDVGAVRFRPEPGTAPPEPEPLVSKVTLSPPATVVYTKQQKPIAGVRYADEPNTPVTEPVEAQEAPKAPEARREIGLPFGVRYSSPPPEETESVADPEPASEELSEAAPSDTSESEAAAVVDATLAEVTDAAPADGSDPTPAEVPEPVSAEPRVEFTAESPAPAPKAIEEPPAPPAPPPPVVAAPSRAEIMETAVPQSPIPAPRPSPPRSSPPHRTPAAPATAARGLAANLSNAAARLRSAVDVPRLSKTAETLGAVVGDRSAPAPDASPESTTPLERSEDPRSSSSEEYRRKLASTGMFDAPRATGLRPPKPLRSRPRLARPDSMQDAIKGLFSSLPVDEIPPVAALEPTVAPVPEPRVDAPGQTILFEADPKKGKAARSATSPSARHPATSDPLYAQALEAAKARGSASLVMLKRTLGVGYSRAAGLMDALVAEGELGEMTASGSRPIR